MADKRLFILAQPDFPKTKGFQLLTRFMQGHREIKVSFATRTAHLAAALATGECDLIFAAGLTNQAHALITDQEPYLAVLPTPLVSQLGLSMATTVSLDQLAEQDLLLPSQGHRSAGNWTLILRWPVPRCRRWKKRTPSTCA